MGASSRDRAVVGRVAGREWQRTGVRVRLAVERGTDGERRAGVPRAAGSVDRGAARPPARRPRGRTLTGPATRDRPRAGSGGARAGRPRGNTGARGDTRLASVRARRPGAAGGGLGGGVASGGGRAWRLADGILVGALGVRLGRSAPPC